MGVGIMMQQHRPAQARVRQGAILGVARAALQRDCLTGTEARACRWSGNRRRRGRVAYINADGRRSSRTLVVAHPQRCGESAPTCIGMRGLGAGDPGRTVSKIPLIGQRITIGIAAAAAIERDGQWSGTSGWIGGGNRNGCTIIRPGVGNAPHLSAVRIGSVIERFGGGVGPKDHRDGAARSQAGHELSRRVAAAGFGRELKDFAADVVAVQVGVVVIRRPDSVRHECATRNRLTPRVVTIGVAWVSHARGWRTTIARRAVNTQAFPYVPAIVRARLSEIDLLPQILSDIVDEKAGAGTVGIERHAERIAQAPGKRFLALLARVSAASRIAASAICALKRIG